MRIRSCVVDEMITHAREDFPVECCVLLRGARDLVTESVRCQNELESGTAFSIPPQELFHFFRTTREMGMEFAGVYHSHPEYPATPSERDVKEFYYPEVSYWVISLQEGLPVVRCFKWGERRFLECNFEVF